VTQSRGMVMIKHVCSTSSKAEGFEQ
jgi:hypothetical protein